MGLGVKGDASEIVAFVAARNPKREKRGRESNIRKAGPPKHIFFKHRNLNALFKYHGLQPRAQRQTIFGKDLQAARQKDGFETRLLKCVFADLRHGRRGFKDNLLKVGAPGKAAATDKRNGRGNDEPPDGAVSESVARKLGHAGAWLERHVNKRCAGGKARRSDQFDRSWNDDPLDFASPEGFGLHALKLRPRFEDNLIDIAKVGGVAVRDRADGARDYERRHRVRIVALFEWTISLTCPYLAIVAWSKSAGERIICMLRTSHRKSQSLEKLKIVQRIRGDSPGGAKCSVNSQLP
jgi:hypothetical protein